MKKASLLFSCLFLLNLSLAYEVDVFTSYQIDDELLEAIDAKIDEKVNEAMKEKDQKIKELKDRIQFLEELQELEMSVITDQLQRDGNIQRENDDVDLDKGDDYLDWMFKEADGGEKAFSCCESITLSSYGYAYDYRQSRLGTYRKHTDDGIRWGYKKDFSEDYLYFAYDVDEENSYWYASTTNGGNEGYFYNEARDICPESKEHSSDKKS